MSHQTVNVEGSQEIGGRDIEWQATVRLSYRPAKLYGPPEHCYEAEAEAEILTLKTEQAIDCELDEDQIIELAWDKFSHESAAADAADYADYINDSLRDR